MACVSWFVLTCLTKSLYYTTHTIMQNMRSLLFPWRTKVKERTFNEYINYTYTVYRQDAESNKLTESSKVIIFPTGAWLKVRKAPVLGLFFAVREAIRKIQSGNLTGQDLFQHCRLGLQSCFAGCCGNTCSNQEISYSSVLFFSVVLSLCKYTTLVWLQVLWYFCEGSRQTHKLVNFVILLA